ncbi:MAG TPA: hypothetical protein VME70_02185 [Mycobacteriales bacterium]|nr:hypothetical protein [Mycobacteriales bacterium]
MFVAVITAALALTGMSVGVAGYAASHAHIKRSSHSQRSAVTPKPHPRLYVEAGDAKYVVYSAVDTNRANSLVLYYLTRHGKPHRVTTVSANAYAFSLAGSILVYEDSNPSNPNANATFRWRDLLTGAHGSTHGGFTATPSGWINTTNAQGRTLESVTVSGKVTILGAPFPRGAQYNTIYANGEVVAYNPTDGSGNGAAKWVSLAHPGVFHTLISEGKAHSTAVCPNATGNRIVCAVYRGLKPSLRLYSLHGKLIVKTTHCAKGVPAVLNNLIAWVPSADHCPVGLRFVNAEGAVKTAPKPLVSGDVISALGGVVAPASGDQRLIFYSSETKRRTLVS